MPPNPRCRTPPSPRLGPKICAASGRPERSVEADVGMGAGPGFLSHTVLLPVFLEPSQIKKLFPIYFPGCKIIICLACQTAGREPQRNTLSSAVCGFYHLLGTQERLALGPRSRKHFVRAGPAPRACCRSFWPSDTLAGTGYYALSRLGEQGRYFMKL